GDRRGGDGRRPVLQLHQAAHGDSRQRPGAGGGPVAGGAAAGTGPEALAAAHGAGSAAGGPAVLRAGPAALVVAVLSGRAQEALLSRLRRFPQGAQPRTRRCSTTSGGQLKRTSRTDEPAPTEV